MLSKISVTQLKTSPAAPVSGFSWRGNRPRLGYCAGNSSKRNKLRFRIVGQSLGDRWKLNDFDASESACLLLFPLVFLILHVSLIEVKLWDSLD